MLTLLQVGDWIANQIIAPQTLLRVVVLLAIGIPAAFVLARLADQTCRRRLSAQVTMIVRKLVL